VLDTHGYHLLSSILTYFTWPLLFRTKHSSAFVFQKANRVEGSEFGAHASTALTPIHGPDYSYSEHYIHYSTNHHADPKPQYMLGTKSRAPNGNNSDDEVICPLPLDFFLKKEAKPLLLRKQCIQSWEPVPPIQNIHSGSTSFSEANKRKNTKS